MVSAALPASLHGASHLPVVFQPYFGLANFSNPGVSAAMLQTGFRYSPDRVPLFVSIDNNFCSRGRKYEWIDHESYRYRRSINNFGISAGFNLFPRQRFSILTGIRYDISNFSGRVVSGSEAVRADVYEYKIAKNSISPFFFIFYRINNTFSVHFNYHFIPEHRYLYHHISSLGLAYNLYGINP